MLPLHVLEAFLSGDFSSLWPPLGSLLTGAYNGLRDLFNKEKEKFDPFGQAAKEMQQELTKWAKDKYDDIVPSTIEEARKQADELRKEFEKWTDDVLKDINGTVGKGLSDGVIDPQTDGGLGETRDIFTPDGEMPMDVGTIPGMGSEGGGLDRSGGGSSSSGPSSGGSSPASPSGGTHPSGGGSQGGSGPDTAGDVGAGPGDFVEYQPGQVVITHPDGSQTVKPWPP